MNSSVSDFTIITRKAVGALPNCTVLTLISNANNSYEMDIPEKTFHSLFSSVIKTAQREIYQAGY